MAHKTSLPQVRESITMKNTVGQTKFYVTISFFTGTATPGEVFVNIAKEGSTLGGICATLSTLISISLQHGVPWDEISKHFRNHSFEPSGQSITGEIYPSLTHAIADTVDRILAHKKETISPKPSEVHTQRDPEHRPSSVDLSLFDDE